MKRSINIIFIAIIIGLGSCSEESFDERIDVSKVQMEFSAGSDIVSRTQLTSNNTVVWEVKDEISLFDPSGSNNLFTTEGNGPSVIFSGKAIETDGGYYALYPYKSEANFINGIVSTMLPYEQTACLGSFDHGLNPAVAVADVQKNLLFKNTCALVKFTLNGEFPMLSKVVLCGNNNEILSGKIIIDMNHENPKAVAADQGFSEIELSGKLEQNGTYYFVVIPGLLENGFTLQFVDESGRIYEKKGTKSVELSAGHILNLGTITPGTFIPSAGYQVIDGVYHIYNSEGLKAWAKAADVLTSKVILENDIDMANMPWTPVGSGISSDMGYAGEFNGNEKTISNLNITSLLDNVGFFGGLAENAKVHDVNFSSALIEGGVSSGVVAGVSLGIIERCKVSSSDVRSGLYSGGIVGKNSVQVVNSNVCDVNVSTDKSGGMVGGISGVSYGKIEYCTVSGNTMISANGSNSRAGGITGQTSEESGIMTSGRLLKCAVDGATVSGTMAGGVAGENGFGTVAQCVVHQTYVKHNLTTDLSSRLGGIVGYNTRGEVVACYSANSKIGDENLMSEAMGGIVGYSYSEKAYVYGCYSTHVYFLGSVSGDESGVGAIAGYTNGHITSCYAILPDNVNNIKLIGKYSSTLLPDHNVEIGATNYDILITDVYDLKVTDGTIWKAKNIWNITAGGFPSIESEYIGEN